MTRVLDVGTGRTFAVPSAAAAVARNGDTITIAPGTYYDCAFWRASHITIAGTGPDAVITDVACAGKAAFVISGDAVVVRDLVFTRIRVPEGNGAGIRAEGTDLTVEDSRFVNNQFGILAGGSAGNLRIIGCAFRANGASLGHTPLDRTPTHAVMAGRLALLRIERSSFSQARGGDHIASAALTTELVGNRLTDEAGAIVGPLVSVAGGQLTLQDNIVDLAAGSADRPGAVLATGDATGIVVRDNRLIEPGGAVPLLRNWTAVAAVAAGNTVPPTTVAVSEDGAAYHRLRAHMAEVRAQAHAVLGLARHRIAALAREFHLIP